MIGWDFHDSLMLPWESINLEHSDLILTLWLLSHQSGSTLNNKTNKQTVSITQKTRFSHFSFRKYILAIYTVVISLLFLFYAYMWWNKLLELTPVFLMAPLAETQINFSRVVTNQLYI